MKNEYPYYLAGRPEAPNSDMPVTDKFTGNVAARVARAYPDAIKAAIEAARRAERPMAKMPAYQRHDTLMHCVKRFTERAEEFAHALCVEAGKPIRDSRGEVTRLIDTFRAAAEESLRSAGEVMTLDIAPRTKGYTGSWKRVPIGACSFISPFNFPLNLAAHKVAPAIAAGCPFVLKPSEKTPIGALLIGETLAETDLPEGAFSVLPAEIEDSAPFVEDERLKLLSFTGSGPVGWAMKARAGRKKVLLELGGNAACVVDEDADIDDAVARIIFGAFYQSGQSCISVQRIIVHEKIYAAFSQKLTAAAAALKSGDPSSEDTFIGPMISEREAQRIESWINSAGARGAKLLCGGARNGAILEASLLENVPRDHELWTREAFGPVAALTTFSDFGDALDMINDSEFGLQAGIFTRDIYKAHRAWDELDVGGVIIGDVPSWRVDNMPYGGVKGSGLGREGIRFAMDEMSEIRLMVLRTKQ